MIKYQKDRKNCRDVFNAFLYENAIYAGKHEIPCLLRAKEVPKKLIPFSKTMSAKSFDAWVHFYEDDYLFERFWRNPRRYLELLRKFEGVILPDFSVFRDMPLNEQVNRISRSRAIGHWLQVNGIRVIPNIRFGDERTFDVCCDGIQQGGVIAIGTHGTIKRVEDRRIFVRGLEYIARKLNPEVIVVYGKAPDTIFGKYSEKGIRIVSFDSSFASANKEVK